MKKVQSVVKFLCFTVLTIIIAVNALVPAQTPQAEQEGKYALRILPHATITVLVDNMSGPGPILGEWGLSFYIETTQHRILFDTGQGQALFYNAHSLDVDLSRIDSVVISHSHSDHTGGLVKALEAIGHPSLYINPGAFLTRFWKDESQILSESMPLSPIQLMQKGITLVETKEPTLVCDGVMVTGQIPRTTDFEDTGVMGSVFLDKDMKVPDPIHDDQALFFRVPEGVVIMLGCGHAGLVNTMQYVSKLLGEQKIYAVIGGTHLLSASPDRMQKTIKALRKYDVQKIMLSHCTGLKAYSMLDRAFPGRCSWPSAGTKLSFGMEKSAGQKP